MNIKEISVGRKIQLECKSRALCYFNLPRTMTVNCCWTPHAQPEVNYLPQLLQDKMFEINVEEMKNSSKKRGLRLLSIV